MSRTASIGSRVPPAVTSTVSPLRLAVEVVARVAAEVLGDVLAEVTAKVPAEVPAEVGARLEDDGVNGSVVA